MAEETKKSCGTCKHYQEFKYGCGCNKHRKVLLADDVCDDYEFSVTDFFKNIWRNHNEK